MEVLGTAKALQVPSSPRGDRPRTASRPVPSPSRGADVPAPVRRRDLRAQPPAPRRHDESGARLLGGRTGSGATAVLPAVLPSSGSASAAGSDVDAVDITPPQDAPAEHGRRAVMPSGPLRRAEVAVGRAVSRRRVVASCLATALVLVTVTPMAASAAGWSNTDFASWLQALLQNDRGDRLTAQPEPATTPTGTPPASVPPSTSSAIATSEETTTAATKATKAAKAARAAKTTAAAKKKATAATTVAKKAPINAGTSGGSLGISSKRSGLPWASGVYIPGSSSSKVEKFGNWRGRDADVVVDWSARSSWDDIVNPDWLYDAWKGTPYTKSFGIPPFPEGSGGSLSECASGAYDSKWRAFGKNIKAAGLADESVIRLGWEFNGDWYEWAAEDPKAFASCWRSVVQAAESTAPALRWEWTVSRGPGESVEDPRRAWPGNDYVDIVGIDSYDMWPGVSSDSSWQQHYSAKYGLKFWADFAKDRGKKVSVPEWGVYPGTAQEGNNGGDNPLYIRKMYGFFRSLGDQMAYEAYFNEPAGYYAGSIYGPQQNPRAAAQYKKSWGG